jgi:hypothetical protein
MREGEPNGYEETREYIPTPEEVVSVIKEIIGDKEYKEGKRREDEKGLYFLELVITEEDGTTTEYSYLRAGKYKEGQALNSVINVVFYDGDGIPVGGHNVADCIDGKWIKTS